MAQTLRRSPSPSQIQPSRARLALIALTVGVVPSIPNQRGVNPKPTWRQTQAGVRQTQIHANFFQQLPIAVLSLFKGLAAIARGIWRSPLRPPAHFAENTYGSSFVQAKSFSSPFTSPRGAPPLARLRFLTNASI
jgi:hypothetical protein